MVVEIEMVTNEKLYPNFSSKNSENNMNWSILVGQKAYLMIWENASDKLKRKHTQEILKSMWWNMKMVEILKCSLFKIDCIYLCNTLDFILLHILSLWNNEGILKLLKTVF